MSSSVNCQFITETLSDGSRVYAVQWDNLKIDCTDYISALEILHALEAGAISFKVERG